MNPITAVDQSRSTPAKHLDDPQLQPPTKRIRLHLAAQMVSTSISTQLLNDIEGIKQQSIAARIEKSTSGNLDLTLCAAPPVTHFNLNVIDQPLALTTYQIKNIGHTYNTIIEQSTSPADLQVALDKVQLDTLTSKECLALSTFYTSSHQAAQALQPILHLDNLSRLRTFAEFAHNKNLINAIHLWIAELMLEDATHGLSCQNGKKLLQDFACNQVVTPEELQAIGIFCFGINGAKQTNAYNIILELAQPNPQNLIAELVSGGGEGHPKQKTLQSIFMTALKTSNLQALNILKQLPDANNAIANCLLGKASFLKYLNTSALQSEAIFNTFIDLAINNIGDYMSQYIKNFVPTDTTKQISLSILHKLIALAPNLTTNKKFLIEVANSAINTNDVEYFKQLNCLPLHSVARHISKNIVEHNRTHFITRLKELDILPTKNDIIRAAKYKASPLMLAEIIKNFPEQPWIDSLLHSNRQMTSFFKSNIHFILHDSERLGLQLTGAHLSVALDKKLSMASLNAIIAKLIPADITRQHVLSAVENFGYDSSGPLLARLADISGESLADIQKVLDNNSSAQDRSIDNLPEIPGAQLLEPLEVIDSESDLATEAESNSDSSDEDNAANNHPLGVVDMLQHVF